MLLSCTLLMVPCMPRLQTRWFASNLLCVLQHIGISLWCFHMVAFVLTATQLLQLHYVSIWRLDVFDSWCYSMLGQHRSVNPCCSCQSALRTTFGDLLQQQLRQQQQQQQQQVAGRLRCFRLLPALRGHGDFIGGEPAG